VAVRYAFGDIISLRWLVRIFALGLLACALSSARAEAVDVKYHGRVSLDSFACTDVKEGSDVSRICYDAAERYMVIRLKATYYHYCAIDPATVQSLQMASSKRQFFESESEAAGQMDPLIAERIRSPRSIGCSRPPQ
jgi:hypothetical protein